MDERRQQPDRRAEPRSLTGRRRDDAKELRRAIADRVSNVLAFRGWSLTRAADLSGVSEGTMRNVVAGKNTSIDTLASIADALDLDLPGLVTRKSQAAQHIT